MNYNSLHILQTDFNEHNLIPVRPFSTNMMHSFYRKFTLSVLYLHGLEFSYRITIRFIGRVRGFPPPLPFFLFYFSSFFDTKNILFCNGELNCFDFVKVFMTFQKYHCFLFSPCANLKSTRVIRDGPFGSMIKSCATHIFRWPHKLGLIGLAENDMKPYLNSKISSKGGRRDALSHFSTDEI